MLMLLIWAIPGNVNGITRKYIYYTPHTESVSLQYVLFLPKLLNIVIKIFFLFFQDFDNHTCDSLLSKYFDTQNNKTKTKTKKQNL